MATNTVDTCIHSENARFLDECDGTEVCMDCGLVLQESLPPLESLNLGVENLDNDFELQKLTEKIQPYGVRLSKTDQKIFLLDWIENGHLPLCVVDQTWFWSKQMIREFNPGQVHPRDRVYFNFQEFSALALYQVLYKNNNPRSLSLIARITGVTEKRLWRLCRIFPLAFDVETLRPSNWMPGLLPMLPMNFKEGMHVGKVADWIQQDFALHPLSLLVIMIFAYLEHRKDLHLSKSRATLSNNSEENAVDIDAASVQTCTKTDLSKMTGVSLATITRGYRRVVTDNIRFNPAILSFKDIST